MPAGGSNALAKARQKQERAADVGDRDYDEQAAKRRQRTLAKKIGRDLCLYALFLAAFTVWTLSGHSSESALLVLLRFGICFCVDVAQRRLTRRRRRELLSLLFFWRFSRVAETRRDHKAILSLRRSTG